MLSDLKSISEAPRFKGGGLGVSFTAKPQARSVSGEGLQLPEREALEDRSPAVAPSSTLLSLEGLEPLGLRVLSHLPCHDCSVNHLEPSFTRQGSVELIAHQTVKMVISVS